MMVNHEPKSERQKSLEESLNKTDYERKMDLLEEFSKESADVICLAVMFAEGFKKTGEDLTKRWETIEKQMEMIQKSFNDGYRQGFYDGIEKGKVYEREEQAAQRELDREWERIRKGGTKKKRRR